MVDRAEPHTKVVPTPAGATVRIIERLGNGAPVVFLHSGVGSAGEWRQVFNLWPDAHRLVAVDAFGDGDGPAGPGAALSTISPIRSSGSQSTWPRPCTWSASRGAA